MDASDEKRNDKTIDKLIGSRSLNMQHDLSGSYLSRGYPEICIDCTSETNPACNFDPNSVQSFCDMEGDSCFTHVNHETVVRGCQRDLPALLRKTIRSDYEYSLCSDRECNNDVVVKQCFACDSWHTLECANGGLPDTFLRNCSTIGATCLVGIDDSGITHRGCSNDFSLAIDRFFNQYEECRANGCNNNTYPTDRLRCYQCAGTSNCDYVHESTDVKPQACRVFNPLDACYIFMDNDSK